MGLIEQGEKLSAADKALATYAITLESTTAAQGNAAQTANSTANKFRFLVARVTELGENIGGQLLPLFAPLLTDMEGIAQGANNAAKFVGFLVKIFLSLAKAIAIVVEIGSSVIAAFAQIAIAIKNIIVGSIQPLIDSFRSLGMVVEAAFLGMQGKFAEASQKFVEGFKLSKNSVSALTHNFQESLADAIGGIKFTGQRTEATIKQITSEISDLFAKSPISAPPLDRAASIQEYKDTLDQIIGEATGGKSVVTPDSSSGNDELVKGQNNLKNAVNETSGAIKQAQKGWKDYAKTAIDALASVIFGKNQILNGLNLQGLLGGVFGGSGKVNQIGTALGIAGKLFGFANGGQFRVGGSGGMDSQLVAFKATPNETVTVTRPGQGMGNVIINQTITPPPGLDTRAVGVMVARMTAETVREIVNRNPGALSPAR
jgi:hypothetical protein